MSSVLGVSTRNNPDGFKVSSSFRHILAVVMTHPPASLRLPGIDPINLIMFVIRLFCTSCALLYCLSCFHGAPRLGAREGRVGPNAARIVGWRKS